MTSSERTLYLGCRGSGRRGFDSRTPYCIAPVEVNVIDVNNLSPAVLICMLTDTGSSLSEKERQEVYWALCDLVGEEEAVQYS